MSRKYVNDRWCVRCGRHDPTPYLKKNLTLFPPCGKVLDIGCGNGRNSNFMKESGFQVTSVDMVEDFGEKVVLGVDPLPEEKYDIILANYILMFLNKKERKKVLRGINANSKPGTLLMVELYPAKDGFPCEIDEIVIFFKKWKKVRKSKDRCILEKEK